MENQQYIQEDEIDIGEYINVIIKRKKLILSIFLAAVVIASIVNLRMPKIYEITSTIQLGSVNEPLINNEEAKAIILNQNLLLSVINDFGLKMKIESLQKAIKISDIKGTNLLKIKMTCSGVDAVDKINDAIINPLILQGQKIYQERLAIINERIKELDAEIKSAEEDIFRTQNLISGLPGVNNTSQADVSLRIILLQNSLPNYEAILTSLRNIRNDFKLLLANSRDFKIFDAPIKSKHPTGFKKNVFAAGMFSLMFGVFLVFILEFLQKRKK